MKTLQSLSIHSKKITPLQELILNSLSSRAEAGRMISEYVASLQNRGGDMGEDFDEEEVKKNLKEKEDMKDDPIKFFHIKGREH